MLNVTPDSLLFFFFWFIDNNWKSNSRRASGAASFFTCLFCFGCLLHEGNKSPLAWVITGRVRESIFMVDCLFFPFPGKSLRPGVGSATFLSWAGLWGMMVTVDNWAPKHALIYPTLTFNEYSQCSAEKDTCRTWRY